MKWSLKFFNASVLIEAIFSVISALVLSILLSLYFRAYWQPFTLILGVAGFLLLKVLEPGLHRFKSWSDNKIEQLLESDPYAARAHVNFFQVCFLSYGFLLGLIYGFLIAIYLSIGYESYLYVVSYFR